MHTILLKKHVVYAEARSASIATCHSRAGALIDNALFWRSNNHRGEYSFCQVVGCEIIFALISTFALSIFWQSRPHPTFFG